MSHARPSFPGAAALHVAVIMDGNGRWAAAHGWPRNAGHVAGAAATRRTVESARRLGLGTLTLYAFSSDNWQRPDPEVAALMRLFREYLASETARCIENGIRLSVIGRRDRLTVGLREAIETAEAATAGCAAMRLRVAVDYSARDSIARAARLFAQEPATPFERALGEACHDGGPVAPVDLLIRTGGERRLSDFLLWECAYAELWFTEQMWPDFGETDLEAALAEFERRERRFGRVSEAQAPTGTGGGA
ncbi:MAG: di-trans,poly-cis-decaprenylcistransferase [Candidatus Eisenbacteria bacterium]|nr:di-trans,poly-cis-decaprenylcistransferase [Candidatus Eisenbacteria bacterium]